MYFLGILYLMSVEIVFIFKIRNAAWWGTAHWISLYLYNGYYYTFNVSMWWRSGVWENMQCYLSLANTATCWTHSTMKINSHHSEFAVMFTIIKSLNSVFSSVFLYIPFFRLASTTEHFKGWWCTFFFKWRLMVISHNVTNTHTGQECKDIMYFFWYVHKCKICYEALTDWEAKWLDWGFFHLFYTFSFINN